MSKEAMKLALEALEMWCPMTATYLNTRDKAITALREALAEPEQEPKCGAIIEVFGKDWRLEYMSLPVGKHKLYTQQHTYTAPAQHKPLTETEIRTLRRDLAGTLDVQYVTFARAIEAAIKENQ